MVLPSAAGLDVGTRSGWALPGVALCAVAPGVAFGGFTPWLEPVVGG